MIEIPDPWMGLLVSAVKDAVTYNHGLLRSETLKEPADYEEHLLHLSQFFEYIKEEYRKQEGPNRLPLKAILGESE